MRYSVLGFKQSAVSSMGLTLDELLLLDYIIIANGTPSMSHIVEDEVSYVWLNHVKINEDLPILNISEGTLRNKLAKLKTAGYISSISVNNKSSRGSRTYYSVTDLTMSLRNDTVTATMSRQNDAVSRPCHSGMTSDNKLKNTNNKLNNDKKKTNKDKLLDNILGKFAEYDFNEKVQERLLDFYSDRIDAKQKPTENQLTATLDLLASVPEKTQLEAIENSIRGGWKTIYLPNSNSSRQQSYVLNNDTESYQEQKQRVEDLRHSNDTYTF